MDQLQLIIERRADLAKKLAPLEKLKAEDAELEIAQRVLERIMTNSDAPSVSHFELKPAPGAESTIFDVLDVGGPMETNELQLFVKNITSDSYKSILSRMKKKGLIKREGSRVWINNSLHNRINKIEEEIPF